MKHTKTIFLLMLLMIFLGSDAYAQIPFSKGRIAISSDGNAHDKDDWAASAASLMMLAKAGLQDKLALYTYSDHIWLNNSPGLQEMDASIKGARNRWGFKKTKFIEAINNQEAAFNGVRDEVNKSSASNPLFIIIGGPTEVVARGLQRAQADKRKFVTLISHSDWNEGHSDHKNPGQWDYHRGTTWPEMKAQFKGPNSPKFIDLRDQNGPNQANFGFNTNGLANKWSYWSWMLNHKDESIRWVYKRMQATGKPDMSDAGMTWFLIKNDENGNQVKLKDFIGKGITGGSVDPDPDPDPEPPTDNCVAIEKNGVIAVEAEHFASQTLTSKRRWYNSTSGSLPKPDPDPVHPGASSGEYLELLPDTRVTHGDPLIIGENYSPTPGNMAILNYKVRFSSPGKYFVWVRALSTNSEDNGIHVGLDGKWPATGARMQWCNGKKQWTWESKQRTPAKHCGEERKIYLEVPTAGVHTISFSMREDGFQIDKFVLSKAYTKPVGTGPAEVLINCGNTNVPVVDGGRVTTASGQVAVTTITGDNNPDVINFKNTSTAPKNSKYIYLITDAAGKILTTEASSHDFEGTSVGICRVYGLSYTGNLNLSGKNVSGKGLSTGKFSVSNNSITVTRKKKGTTNPDPVTGIAIPGSFEAEAFSKKSGNVVVENTPGGSGKNLGFINNGDFTEYAVEVTSAGTYSFQVLASSGTKGGTIDIMEGAKKVGTITVPGNGKWHDYKTYSKNVSLSKGKKALKLMFKGGAGYLFNLDKVTVSKSQNTGTGNGNKTNTVTLKPIHDAYLQGTSRYNTNIVRVEKGRRTAYLMYDLSAIKGEIKKAELTFQIEGDPGAGKLNVNVGKGVNWTENNLSNSNKPASLGILGSFSGKFGLNEKKSIELKTGLMKKGKISLLLTAVSGNDFAFASKEHGKKAAPQLIITYTSGKALEDGNAEISMYPNPTQDLVNVTGLVVGDIVKVYNTLGMLQKEVVVKEDATTTIDMSQFSSGYYLMNILREDNTRVIRKLIKE
ncbi:carbohydrate-binding protein [Aquimarina sp. ERC-38]|uniref:carbohydrate-binding protein n=1 Tax=Aquimarina sp. ERC-38 TaxID=2949996 RepID=UPI0022452AEB|nr:carbohydrate-binding protein [Aquimarina sp. ERC-38]UZO81215.1 carbohydrate-binding protein [Aquimarina sp. ERC-38]